jgi:hypothetical protein
VNTFEERLSDALLEAEARGPAGHPGGGRAIFETYVRARQRRHRLTLAMRLTVAALVAGVGATTVAVRLTDGPVGGTTPAVTPADSPGLSNGGQAEARSPQVACVKRTIGGCRLLVG